MLSHCSTSRENISDSVSRQWGISRRGELSKLMWLQFKINDCQSVALYISFYGYSLHSLKQCAKNNFSSSHCPLQPAMAFLDLSLPACHLLRDKLTLIYPYGLCRCLRFSLQSLFQRKNFTSYYRRLSSFKI